MHRRGNTELWPPWNFLYQINLVDLTEEAEEFGKRGGGFEDYELFSVMHCIFCLLEIFGLWDRVDTAQEAESRPCSERGKARTCSSRASLCGVPRRIFPIYITGESFGQAGLPIRSEGTVAA
jgi:hypothetical protein